MNKKNRVTTRGYFTKRLRDNGYYVSRIFNDFGIHDPRRWMVVINPGEETVFVTCCVNKDFYGDLVFEFNDGGINLPRNYQLKTDSMEVIIELLVAHNIYGKQKE